jgi:carbon monoxide dehydrogenase subunit G
MRFELADTIAAPPDKVFRLTTDVDRFGEWMPGFVRVEKHTPGPLVTGSRFRETRKMFGRDSTEEFEATLVDAPRTLDLFVDGAKGTSGKGEFRFRYEFSPSGAGTRVKLAGEITKMGCVGAVFGFLFAGLFKKMIGKDLTAMKSWIEKQP